MDNPAADYSNLWPYFIGYDTKDATAALVAIQSCVEQEALAGNSTKTIPMMHYLYESEVRKIGFKRPRSQDEHGQLWDGINTDQHHSTDFSYTRFLVPQYWRSNETHTNFRKWALFTDPDVMWMQSPSLLIEEVENSSQKDKAVYVVKHPDYVADSSRKLGDLRQRQYGRKNWSSVILFNMHYFNNAKTNNRMIREVNTRHRDYLHGFGWLDDIEIGTIGQKWNVLVNEPGMNYTEDDLERAGLVHFTRGTPEMEVEGDTTPQWLKKRFYQTLYAFMGNSRGAANAMIPEHVVHKMVAAVGSHA